MDIMFPKNKIEDAENLFDSNFSANSTMMENWSSNPDDFLDSIFSLDNDFLNNFDDPQKFETLEDLSFRMKMESEEHEMTLPLKNISNKVEISKLGNMSSTSSDSGLSSDNLDIEMSPRYEPLTPDISREVRESNKHPIILQNNCSTNNISKNPIDNYASIKNIQKPKVIVQKVPQVLKLSTTNSKGKQPKYKKEIKIVKLSPQMFTTPNNKTITIQVKNSTSGAKIQANPGTLFMNKSKVTEVKKLVHVQNSSNPRSILIPVSLQDVKDLKTFKIVNGSNLKTNSSKKSNFATTNEKNKNFDDTLSDNSSDNEGVCIDDDYYCSEHNYEKMKQSCQGKNYPKLNLAPEERRLLSKEGINLPTHYPLTKSEERELKRIRRKIRNKISAQDSRKRKKEYVDGLEERVKQCTEENQTLMKRIKLLQYNNHNLISQMKKLQSIITKGTNKTAHPTTCLMVLLLSLALVAAPNFKLGQNIKESELEEFVGGTTLQNRRNLLYDVKEQGFDEMTMGEILGSLEPAESLLQTSDTCNQDLFHQFKNDATIYKKDKMNNEIIDFGVDDQNWYITKENLINSKVQSNSFNNLAEAFQKNMDKPHCSEFNVHHDDHGILFDKDVMEIISPKSNAIYDIDIKVGTFNGCSGNIDVFADTNHHDQNDKKLNLSHTQIF